MKEHILKYLLGESYITITLTGESGFLIQIRGIKTDKIAILLREVADSYEKIGRRNDNTWIVDNYIEERTLTSSIPQW